MRLSNTSLSISIAIPFLLPLNPEPKTPALLAYAIIAGMPVVRKELYMSRRCVVIALAVSCLTLQGCWVPQVIQGVRPEIFPSPVASSGPNLDITLESKIVAMGTRLIALGKRTSAQLLMSTGIANHRQVLENRFFTTLKPPVILPLTGHAQGALTVITMRLAPVAIRLIC